MPKVLQSLGGRPTVDSVEPSDHLGPFPERAARPLAPAQGNTPEAVSPADPRVPLLLIALSEIAAEAASLHVLLLHVFGGHECALPGALAMAQKIGLLADTVASSMGEVAYCDADEWLFSPRILEAMEQAKGARHG